MASNHVYLKGGGNDVDRLFHAISDCYTDDRDLRIVTGVGPDGVPYVMFKVGQGMWTNPIPSDHDPNRD